MEKSWLLVEWIQKDILSPSFDVVNSKCLEGKQDVCVGKLSILREKYSNNTRPGKVLFISDNKQLLKRMKSMLVNMKEQMRITMEMFNNTIGQMKTELMEECQRLETTRLSGTVNGNSNTTQKISKIVKTTDDKDSQTSQRYSPKYITKLRNSLTNGYEELTTMMLALKEDPVNGDCGSEQRDQRNRIITASKKSKRDTDDDFTSNVGPLKKKIRAWHELKGVEIKKDNTIVMESKGTPKSSIPSMRQYINRKVLSAVDNVSNTESHTQITKLKQINNNALNITKMSAKDCHIDESIKEITIINQSEPDAAEVTRLSVKSDNGKSPDKSDTLKVNKTNKRKVSSTNENADSVNLDNNNTFSFSDNNEVNPDIVLDKTQEEMVPIGNGNTFISKRVYDNLNWNSYTSATRKLLQILFSRETLSTHSLSGKQSPAFSNKPAKKQLNPLTVDDIVATVSKKCDIKESFVRTCITIKCADEAKMLRQRTSRNRSIQDENIPTPNNL